jgi:hypothetical protein
MAIKVKDITSSVEKWVTRASGAADIFAAEAEKAADSWQKNTQAAQGTYQQGITAPGIPARFARGVAKAGSAKFARKIREVARDRYGPGITAGQADYRADVEPYFSTLASLTLSPRKMRGDPANYNRVTEVGKALNAKRLAVLATGG